MYIYFAILEENVTYATAKEKLEKKKIEILKHYPKLNVIKFKSAEKLNDKKFNFLKSWELEKDDFTLG